jgi:predicted DCC family thiol-disulfide oxidoreductase YuxK
MKIQTEIASFLANIAKDKKIILFDGVCNLCNSAVLFVIKNDKKDIFRFVALQSDFGKEICNYIGVDQNKIDSIIYIIPELLIITNRRLLLKLQKSWEEFTVSFQFLKYFLKNSEIIFTIILLKTDTNGMAKKKAVLFLLRS